MRLRPAHLRLPGNIEQSPAIPSQVKFQANVQLVGGVPFISDADLRAALAKANASSESTDAAVAAYGDRESPGSNQRWRSLPCSRSSPSSSPSGSRPDNRGQLQSRPVLLRSRLPRRGLAREHERSLETLA